MGMQVTHTWVVDSQLCDYVFFFLKPFHYIIFILFYMIIIIISVAVALAAMFSLSDSLLTIAFS